MSSPAHVWAVIVTCAAASDASHRQRHGRMLRSDSGMVGTFDLPHFVCDRAKRWCCVKWWQVTAGVCALLSGVWFALRPADGSPLIIGFGVVLALLGMLQIAMVLRTGRRVPNADPQA